MIDSALGYQFKNKPQKVGFQTKARQFLFSPIKLKPHTVIKLEAKKSGLLYFSRLLSYLN